MELNAVSGQRPSVFAQPRLKAWGGEAEPIPLEGQRPGYLLRERMGAYSVSPTNCRAFGPVDEPNRNSQACGLG